MSCDGFGVKQNDYPFLSHVLVGRIHVVQPAGVRTKPGNYTTHFTASVLSSSRKSGPVKKRRGLLHDHELNLNNVAGRV